MVWWDPPSQCKSLYRMEMDSTSPSLSFGCCCCCCSPLYLLLLFGLLLPKSMAATTSFTFPPRHLWPIGFGFRPTEEELITHHLKNKMFGHAPLVRYIREIDLYNYEPWELPDQSLLTSDNYEWFFFRADTPKTRRTTATGCWRTTGDDRPIKARGTNKVIATRKILVFYQGRGANAVRTKWVIHEYHLHPDTNISYQRERSFVVCRLKENADERDVSTCDQDDHNKKGTHRAIQEMNRDAQANGQPAFADFQSPNAYDGEVNMQPIQLEASENEVNITELLNSMFAPDEYFHDVNSKMCKSPWCSEPEPEPALMDFQPSNGNDASTSELNLTELLNSVLGEDDENCDEVTSNNHIDASSNKHELDSMVFELQYGGFGSNTDTDTAFGLPINHLSPNRFPDFTRSTIKKSRRSPLTVKRFQYKEEKDELQRKSSVLSGEGEARTSDDSDPGQRTFKIKAQHQPLSSNVVRYERDRLKREIQSKAMSQLQNKAKDKEDEKHIEIVDSPQLELTTTDSNNGLKSKAGNKATESTRNCFSYILTTKRIHHKSSLPLVYVAKAFLGIVMFLMFAQEVLLYGHRR